MDLNKIIGSGLLYLLPFSGLGQDQYPPEVEKALQGTTNRAELENALQYCYKTNDPLKIKSVNFLIANMPIHSSHNYYWADESGKRIEYDEAKYSTFKQAVEAFDDLKNRLGKLHPVPYTYRDIDSITALTLIEDIEMAQKAFTLRLDFGPSKEQEETYLEYILPYRTSIEPLQNWRKIYAEKFSKLINREDPLDSQILSIGKNIKSWFTNTYKIENRGEPLPRLGALQLLSRKKGACEDIAGLAAFMARSQGYEATVDFVPAWATASGVHFLNYIKISSNQKNHYDAADGYILDTLAREPAKVLRTTYSIQPGTIAYQLKNDTTQIPDNFMRLQNYIDVTQEYWQTSDVNADLFKPGSSGLPQVVYLSVWNFAKWRPVWYAKPEIAGTAIFTNMCKGVVYLPLYFINGKTMAAGWPIVNGYYGTLILQPNIEKKHTVYIKEEPKYLAFRPAKKYRLFYWQNSWLPLGERIPDEKTKELIFDNVPLNALLLLIPEYTQGKDRPFIITENGERFWF